MPVTGYISDILISETVAGLGSYFPQWMNVNHPTSGSLLGDFLKPFQEQLLEFGFYLNVERRRKRWDNWLGEPSRAWWVTCPYQAKDVTSVTAWTSNGPIPLVCATTEWGFLSETGPVFIIDDDEGAIYFRNLERAVISQSVTGTVTLPDLMKGSDIYWIDPQGVQWIVYAGSVNIVGPVVSLNCTGTVTISYSSLNMFNLASSGYASINNGPPIPLNYQDLWTDIDETGLIVDEYRLNGEDNETYWRRLSTVFPFPGSPAPDGLEQAISRSIGLSGDYWWDGVMTLTWPVTGVSNVWVCNYPATGFSVMEPMKRQGSVNYIEKADPYNTYVFQGSSLLTAPLSGGMITYPGSGSYEFFASYSYLNWQTSGTSQGITALFPTKNSTPGLRRVMWTYGVSVNSVNDPIWKQNNLLNPDGSPNQEFQALGDQIMERVPVTLGYVSWNSVRWYKGGSTLPSENFRPVMMDQ